ncbi:MFS transporter [Microbulbifer agarilyticus]|uniref:MFS transporter n=1 Tax=Microbulbifer agarilyticus TaxID=260552 RepID=A0A1Q2M276_9GAMM|nr:MFS transporter [Microbulbifer agarilyticus]AQQ66825.1 MFS transporter [Microbulbifer agarilyticus]
MQGSTIGLKEKVGYGLGDTASNIVFQVVVNFLLMFYTDVFGISAAAAGTLLLVVRLFDGITDPLMGGIADRTRTRWGSYRPYLLLLALPYGALAILAFSTPDLGAQGKLIYAYVTYLLLMTVYTAINIPYSALGGVISSDVRERTSVQTYRFAMAMVGGVLVSAAMLPLVDFFGQGDKARGFQLSVAALAGVACLCFFICFATTRERVTVSQPSGARSIGRDFLNLFQNHQWNLIAASTFLLLVLVAMRGAVTPFYVQYFFGMPNWIGTFITVGMLAGVAGALATNVLIRRYCKVQLFRWALAVNIACHLFLLPLDGNQFWWALTLSLIANFVHMITIPLLFSMVADTVDDGNRQGLGQSMAMGYSGHLMALKLGLAVGGACAGWLLAAFGYVPNVEQSPLALTGILVIYAGGPVLCGLGAWWLMRHYRLTSSVIENAISSQREATSQPTLSQASGT